MKKVIILFGGRSAEHEVSLQSAKNILDAIDKEKFTPILVGIDKDGKWLLQNTSDFLINQDDPKNIKLNPNGAPCVMSFGGKIMNLRTGQDFPFDVVFPILHGPFGEDGTVQGLLKINQVPFVGTGVLGSAVGMDKDMAKRLLRDSGIPTSRFIVLRDFEAVPPYKDITAKLGSPIFVKPANMGSSVGVNKIETEVEYINFVREAFNYDSKIILEEYINGREIECAVLGNDEVISSIPGEIKSTHSFYSYDAKYIDENGAVTEIPAKLSPEKIK
jgi:D-alanine-D-alanine ligase